MKINIFCDNKDSWLWNTSEIFLKNLEIMGHANSQTTINWYGSSWDKANHLAVATLNDWAEQGITQFKAN